MSRFYAPDDTVTAISIFNNVEAAEESNRRALALIEQNPGTPAHRFSYGSGRAGDRAYIGIAHRGAGPAVETT